MLLPDLIINQIAAGEVVENAASAVKELIENALDAGATEITIRIEKGGLDKLSIEDNGCGMSLEDALLSLKRHATSKIRTTADLESLSTLGFRGEALAALASIAKLTLKTSDGNEASQIQVDGGGHVVVEKMARNRGTTVEARELFYNTPARLKFQKSAAANAAAVLKVVEAMSLAYPEVRFTLYSNEKLTFRCFQTDWKLRAEEILGKFAHEVKTPLIRGLLGRPEEGKANRSGQLLFINRRLVVSPLIAKAVKEGYGTRMQESLFPLFLLFLELPPDWVDVNIHPQKKEVRFRDQAGLFQIVRDAVFNAFGEIKMTAPLPWEINPYPRKEFTEWKERVQETEEQFRLEETPLSLPLEVVATPLAVLGDFLLLREEWQVIDLRGAEARIAFEAMESQSPPMQALLWPIEVATKEPEALKEMLGQVHVEARIMGKQKIAIDAIPENLHADYVLSFIEEVGKRQIAAAVTKAIRMAKRNYSLAEALLIWKNLGKCKDQTYDPLGRKISSHLTKEILTGLFA